MIIMRQETIWSFCFALFIASVYLGVRTIFEYRKLCANNASATSTSIMLRGAPMNEADFLKKVYEMIQDEVSILVTDEKEEFVKSLREKLVREYEMLEAARISQPDYALHSTGAVVVDSSKTHRTSIWDLSTRDPSTVIVKTSENVVPGVCWPFSGSLGHLTIRLSTSSNDVVNVSSIIYQHASSRLLTSKDLRNAPKNIEVSGGLSRDSLQLAGRFVYSPSETGTQHFHLSNRILAKFLRLTVVDNYGGDYTCLYRIKVHGDLLAEQQDQSRLNGNIET